MTKSLAIVSAGRALGRRLKETDWRIVVVAGRTEASAKRGPRFIGGGRPADGVRSTLAAATTILLTVPDDAIASVAGELALSAGADLRSKVVLHTGGALDASILLPLRFRGAAVGSMHPLQTFNGVSVPPLEGKVFAIEGEEPAVRVARKIARSLGGVPVGICAEKKPLYHAAGGFAAGLSLAGFKRREAVRAVVSLTRQVLDNYEKLGPQKAWTGSLALEAISGHVNVAVAKAKGGSE